MSLQPAASAISICHPKLLYLSTAGLPDFQLQVWSPGACQDGGWFPLSHFLASDLVLDPCNSDI